MTWKQAPKEFHVILHLGRFSRNTLHRSCTARETVSSAVAEIAGKDSATFIFFNVVRDCGTDTLVLPAWLEAWPGARRHEVVALNVEGWTRSSLAPRIRRFCRQRIDRQQRQQLRRDHECDRFSKNLWWMFTSSSFKQGCLTNSNF